MKNKLRDYLNRALEFPIEIHLESSSRCNSHCLTCPRDKMQRELGEMDIALFKKAVEETVSYKMDYIHLHLNGEPLFLPIDDLVWRINYAKELNESTKIVMFTNGSLLDEEHADKILASRLDTLVISVDGGCKEDYEAVRRGLSWDKLVWNVSYLMRKRNSLKSKLWVQTAIVPQQANKNSVNTYYSVFYGLGVDHCAGSGVINIGGLIDADSMKLVGQKDVAEDINLPCLRTFMDLSIFSDGRAAVCCQDVVGAFIVGDLKTQSLKEIWQGKVMTDVRDKFVYGKKKELPFCGECDFMKGCVPEEFWRIDKQDWINIYEECKNRVIRGI